MTSSKANADGGTVRWDIIHIAFPNITAGGSASATAADSYKITLTGSGIFQLGDEGDVTGGGTWTTYSGSTITGSGTYVVTGLIRFDVAPGTLAGTPLIDHIGNIANTHAGLAILPQVLRWKPRGTRPELHSSRNPAPAFRRDHCVEGLRVLCQSPGWR
jgi:hypothetical protein